ncbi:MAG: hypothetical protein Q9162_000579 [Coniocarpon cinnabarinum]
MPELRKRKDPPPAPAQTKSKPAAKKRATSKSASSTPAPAKPTSDSKPAKASSSSGAKSPKSTSQPEAGDQLVVEELRDLTVQDHDGEETSLPDIFDKNGGKSIAIFTYPKASTPGCTTQACLFRDSYEDLHPSFDVYGLSNDSPKSNTNFKEKQKLTYSLLCDPKRALISKLGFGKAGGSGTTRGVVVLDKDGKILAWMTGGPQSTLDAVKGLMSKSEAKL